MTGTPSPVASRETHVPEPVLYGENRHVVCILAGDLTRSQGKYRGYRELDFEVGIGAFYPFDFRVTKVFMRRDYRCGPGGEFSHMRTAADHPEAEVYWQVEYVEQPKEWRDGAWRKRV